MTFFDWGDPLFLALVAAVTTAVAQIFFRQALLTLSASATTSIVNGTMLIGGTITLAAQGGVGEWAPMGLVWFALVGLSGPFGGRFLQYKGVQYIGLARTQVLTQTTPVWASIIAVLFLGEVMTLGIAAGTAGIFAGSVLLVIDRKKAPVSAPLKFYAFPMGSALLRGVNPAFRKMGILLIPSAALAVIVSAAVGVACSLLSERFFEKKRPSGWDRTGLLWALGGGLLNFGGVMAFWVAIRLGEIVTVIPIFRLSILLVLLLSWIFFRRQERITWEVIAGGLLAVAGALVITGMK